MYSSERGVGFEKNTNLLEEMEKGTSSKPICHYYGDKGHIRPLCHIRNVKFTNDNMDWILIRVIFCI